MESSVRALPRPIVSIHDHTGGNTIVITNQVHGA
jgi:hypothetical protein